MRQPRPTLVHVVLALVAGVLAAGCEMGAAPTPTRSVDPSAGPIIEADADFCSVLDTLESEHQILREIRLRPGNRHQLTAQINQLDIAWDDVRIMAPRGMADQMEAMDWAVIDLGLAVEDYTTTERLAEAADHVFKQDIAFDRAIGRLRARTTCDPWAPTPRPAHTPPPAPSTSIGPVASALPSVPPRTTR